MLRLSFELFEELSVMLGDDRRTILARDGVEQLIRSRPIEREAAQEHLAVISDARIAFDLVR